MTTLMREQDSSEIDGLMTLNETEQNLIRQEFKQYFQTMLSQVALAQHHIQLLEVASKPAIQKQQKPT